MDLEDTIVAVASAAGGALRGVVRMSGPSALALAAQRVAETPDAERPAQAEIAPTRPAHAVPGCFRLPTGELLPGVVYRWPTARSYTGQPAVEWHTIGSPPLLEACIRAWCADGARLARPGEFTLRAFLAGRLDLTQAEAVLGVIDSRDERQLRQALTQLAGGIGQPLHALRDKLLDLLAHLEAGLDFVEEEIEFITRPQLLAGIEEVARHVAALADQMRSRGTHSGLPRVALVGSPNAGKSSLFNRLSGGRALVSPQAGTTRDALTAEATIAGQPIELIDTAGSEPVDSAAPSLAAAAQRQAVAAAASATLRLWCVDASEPWDEARRAELQAVLPHDAQSDLPPTVVVLTKSDLGAPADASPVFASLPVVAVSSVTGAGLDRLRQEIAAALERDAAGHAIPSTSLRCRDSLHGAAAALARARQAAEQGAGEEFVAADLRQALEALGEVVGAVYTDDILDRIFSRFCIGK